MSKPTIYVSVMGGVVEDVSAPAGTTVIVLDYETEWTEDEDNDISGADIRTDENGTPYLHTEWEGHKP